MGLIVKGSVHELLHGHFAGHEISTKEFLGPALAIGKEKRTSMTKS